MLDLTVLNDKSYDVKLIDGTMLHIKRPSQSMVQYLLNLRDLAGTNDEKVLLKAFASLFARILNRNKEGNVYSDSQLSEEYDYQTIAFVVEDYFKFWDEEVGESVDFPQGQQGEQPNHTSQLA